MKIYQSMGKPVFYNIEVLYKWVETLGPNR